jgi:hypothetical protein
MQVSTADRHCSPQHAATVQFTDAHPTRCCNRSNAKTAGNSPEPDRCLPQLVAKLTNCMQQGPSHKLTVHQLLKKSPAFYGTPKSKTAFTSARHLSPPWARTINPHPFYVFKIQFNILSGLEARNWTGAPLHGVWDRPWGE